MSVKVNPLPIQDLEARLEALAEPFGVSAEKVVLAYEQGSWTTATRPWTSSWPRRQ